MKRTPDRNAAALPTEAADDSEADLRGYEQSYRGRVVAMRNGPRVGVVEADDGRRLEFAYDVVEVSGSVDRVSRVRSGMRVTFDIGLTERGPRIVRLWVGYASPIF